jgi:hypothetical protein
MHYGTPLYHVGWDIASVHCFSMPLFTLKSHFIS